MGLFSADPVFDATLGELRREHGLWVGQLALPPHGTVELRIAGGRKAPDLASLSAAIALPAQYASLRPAVADELFEHYGPGWEAWKAGDLEGEVTSFPEISMAGDVWPFVQVERVDVDASRRDFPAEVRMTVAWDEEHTLGARLDGARLVELCGSVGP